VAQRKTIARFAHILERIRRNGLGKLYATGYEDLTLRVGLIMFGKLRTRNKDELQEIIPL